MKPVKFGKYELVRKVATGGMAHVFLARQISIGGFEKDVAIKRILPFGVEDERFVKLLMREARLAARLTHQNIVQIYDVGLEAGSFYIAMEYVVGRDMRHIVRRARELGRPLSIGQSTKIASGVALGLAHAHAATDADGKPLGIVHRDISPTNVLVSVDGCVKVVDFGIARGSETPTGTESGIVLGKRGYMAPEQILGQPVDGGTDTFSLGVLLYEWTTQRPLFRRESPLLTTQATLEQPIVPPSSLVQFFPKGLEKIIMRALQRDRSKRYPNILRMHEALEYFLSHSEHDCSGLELGNLVRSFFPDLESGLHRESAAAEQGDGNEPGQPSGSTEYVSDVGTSVPWAVRPPPADVNGSWMMWAALALLLLVCVASVVVWLLLLS